MVKSDFRPEVEI